MCRGAQDNFVDEDTVLNVRKAWLSELQLSQDAGRVQTTLLAAPRPSLISTGRCLSSSV